MLWGKVVCLGEAVSWEKGKQVPCPWSEALQTGAPFCGTVAKLLLLQGPGQNPALKKHYQWHVVRCHEEEDITEIWAIIHYCCQFYRTNVSIKQPRPRVSDASRSSQPWKSRSGTLMLGTSWGQGHHWGSPQTRAQMPCQSSNLCHFISFSKVLFLPPPLTETPDCASPSEVTWCPHLSSGCTLMFPPRLFPHQGCSQDHSVSVSCCKPSGTGSINQLPSGKVWLLTVEFSKYWLILA